MAESDTDPVGTGMNFIEHTKYHHLRVSDQLRGLPAPPLQLPADETLPISDLPDTGGMASPADLHDLIESRTSVRSYRSEALSLSALSLMLRETQGVRKVVRNIHTLRYVPSAGARHSFETYLLINRVEGLDPGIYRYLPLSHQLIQMKKGAEYAGILAKACLDQKMVESGAVTFFWTAVIYRMKWRYSERAYRYVLLDAGHVCQNLYLSALSLGCGVCAIAAFDDDLLNEALGLDGTEQFAVYAASAGLLK
ncbi:MAG TPA: SagB/ThcOx family dehydrogenase [Lentimicrobium sp.]|jgi:SagB-type dehydrogenase family enzyme|nr:SagB/ThcOx family dehydrogenase [Lentimicrobium sp.]